MPFRQTHLLGIEPLHPGEITTLLDLADRYADVTRKGLPAGDALQGLTQVNLFFEPPPAPSPPSSSRASASARRSSPWASPSPPSARARP
jgi:hypothetical protein